MAVKPVGCYPITLRGGVSVSPVQTERNKRGATFTTITDSFNRANNALTMGATDTGQTWTYISTGVWGINGNQAYNPTNTGTQANAAVVDAGVASCSVQVTFATHFANQRLMFRAVDASNFFIVNDEGTSYQIYRMQTGSLNPIANFPATTANGDIIKIVLSGPSITLFVNGSQAVATSDSFQQNATQHGISADGTNTGRWDDFSITVP